MSNYPECEAFRDVPHRYAICRCERQPEKCEQWRAKHVGKPFVPLVAVPGEHHQHATRHPRPQPGTELKEIFQSLGVTLPNCFTCGQVGARMNAIGVDGCRRERDALIEGIKDRAKTVTYAQWLTAAANAVTTGLIFAINPLDPLPGLFDEALRRAEEKTQ